MDKRIYNQRPRRFNSPDELWEAFCDYVEYCEKNPWYKTEPTKQGLVQVPVGKPLTFMGFSAYCGLTHQGLLNYGELKGREDFFEIFTRIREIIDNHQYEGAAVGVYNHTLIARRLGLVDKRQNDVTVNDVTNYDDVSNDELQARIQLLKEKRANEQKEGNKEGA